MRESDKYTREERLNALVERCRVAGAALANGHLDAAGGADVFRSAANDLEEHIVAIFGRNLRDQERAEKARIWHEAEAAKNRRAHDELLETLARQAVIRDEHQREQREAAARADQVSIELPDGANRKLSS